AAKESDERHVARERADGGAVLGREVVEIIDRAQAAGARHVLHDHARIAGNEPAEMARQEPRIGVVTAARPIADDQIDLLAPVETGDRTGVRGAHRQGRGDRHRRSPTREHPSSQYAGAKVIARGGAFNGSAYADDIWGAW